MADLNPNTACEHGHQRRKCPYCECIQLEAWVERLRVALVFVDHRHVCDTIPPDVICSVCERIKTALAEPPA